MATIYGSIMGIKLLSEPVGGGVRSIAEVTVEMPAYSASSDNGQLGAGGFDRGAATTDSLATMIAKQRRDGKTVTLPTVTSGGGAILAESGKHGSTEFFAGTFAVSGGNLTFNVTNSGGTEIDAASGISDRPLRVLVPYLAA
jgi:hypothetical protein